ncbi:hypothetical protein K438DRAFT_1789270 [Mycena galopus ATCC 62051]|nr:hypothetical protein K438DRAFT_1789270 [Mycena galopus ATCC 62051]
MTVYAFQFQGIILRLFSRFNFLRRSKTVFSRRPSGEMGPRTLPNCLRDKPRNHGRRSVHKDRAAREKHFGTSMAVDDRMDLISASLRRKSGSEGDCEGGNGSQREEVVSGLAMERENAPAAEKTPISF